MRLRVPERKPPVSDMLTRAAAEVTLGAEVVDAELVDEQPTAAVEMAASLRQLAAMIVANPDLVDDGGPMRYTFDRVLLPTYTKEATAAIARAGVHIGARVAKHQDERWAGVTVDFGSRVNLFVYADREQICERKVVGQKTVTKEVPDPDALAAVPKVTVTETVDEVEWICSPLLANELPAGAR